MNSKAICTINMTKLNIVCHLGMLTTLLVNKLIRNQITNNRFAKGAISSPKTAIKLAKSLGILSHEKNKNAVVIM